MLVSYEGASIIIHPRFDLGQARRDEVKGNVNQDDSGINLVPSDFITFRIL